MCRRLAHAWNCGCAAFEWDFCRDATQQNMFQDMPCADTPYDPNDPNRYAVKSMDSATLHNFGHCCSSRCCQEDLNQIIYKLLDLELRYGMTTGGNWADRSKRGDGSQAMRNFHKQLRDNIRTHAQRHFEKCLPKHEKDWIFTNELRQKNGETPCCPATLQVPDRPEISDNYRQRWEEIVEVWLSYDSTQADFSNFYNWERTSQGNQVRATASRLGLAGVASAAAAMGMPRSAKAPKPDPLLAQELDTLAGAYRTIAGVKACVELIEDANFTSELRDPKGREASLNMARYDILRVEHTLINPACSQEIASRQHQLTGELFCAITAVNIKWTDIDTVTTLPPLPNPRNQQDEVLLRHPEFADVGVLSRSIDALWQNVMSTIAPPQSPMIKSAPAMQQYVENLSAWMEHLLGMERQLRDMEIASCRPNVAHKKEDFEETIDLIRALIDEKKRSAVDGNVASGGSGGEVPPPPPPPPGAGGGSGYRFPQGPKGRGKQPVYKDSEGGNGGGRDGGAGPSYGGRAGQQYQASDRGGLPATGPVASGKKSITNTSSTQLGRPATHGGGGIPSPSKLPQPMRPAKNGVTKTTAGMETSAPGAPNAKYNSAGSIVQDSFAVSKTGRASSKSSKPGVQNSINGPVNNTQKPNKTKPPQATSSQSVLHQGSDRTKKSVKEARFDGRYEDDNIKKGVAAGELGDRHKS